MNNERITHPVDAAKSAPEAIEPSGSFTRRAFVGTAALAGAGFATLSAAAQTRDDLLAGRQGDYASDPGPTNQPFSPRTRTPIVHRLQTTEAWVLSGSITSRAKGAWRWPRQARKPEQWIGMRTTVALCR